MDTHEERVLHARLASLNAEILRFIVRIGDADLKNERWPHDRAAEIDLATRLSEVSRLVLSHADRLPNPSPVPRIIEGAFRSSSQSNRDPS